MPETPNLDGFDFKGALDKGASINDISNYLKVTPAEIADHLASKSGFDIAGARATKKVDDPTIIRYLLGDKPGIDQSRIKDATKKTLGIQVDPANIAKDVVSGGAGAVATYLTAQTVVGAPFAGLVGSATMATVNKALEYALGQDEYKSPLDTAAKIGIDTAWNEIGGKILETPFKLTNAIDSLARSYTADPITHSFVKESLLDPDLARLSPTIAQWLKSKGSKLGGLATGFENLFAPTNKSIALENSFDAAKDVGDEFVASLSGRKGIRVGQSDQMAQMVKEGAEAQFLELKTESNARGDLVKFISEHPDNQLVTPIMGEGKTINPATGKPNLVQTGEKVVNGSVNYNNALQAIKSIRDNYYKPNITPDPNNPVIKTINEILEGVNAKFDKNGNIISHDPVSFGKAWEDKKIANAAGWGSPLTNVNAVDPKFKQVAAAIDRDIEESIPNWKVGSQQASALYAESKLITQKRNLLYNNTTDVGKSLDDLINNSSGVKQNFYAILDDPNKLANFLNTNKVVIPDSTKSIAGNAVEVKYVSTNAKADAQAATIQRILNGAEGPSPRDPNKNFFDPAKITGFLNDPERQDSLETIFGKPALSNVQQLFKNIVNTAEKGQNIGASRYLGLKAGTYGIALGSGITTAIASGHFTPGLAAGAIGVTTTVGAAGLAKLMTNQDTARILIDMAQGTPIKMSVVTATRLITNTLKNTPVTITYSDGSQEAGKINTDGKFTIPLTNDIDSIMKGLRLK